MLPILFRDESIIAIHKPAGLLVHRSELDHNETRFAVQLLRDQIGRHVHPVHRLDKGTSGVLMFALDRTMAALLARQFEAQTVHKRYLAVVRGHPPVTGHIDHPLSRRRDQAERSRHALNDAPQAAVTDFTRLATVELPWEIDRYPTSRYGLLALTPRTGRRHQLRRHMKHIAHPIIGDATFGKGAHNRRFQEELGSHRLLLACVEMRFIHPVTKDEVTLLAPPSDDFAGLLERLGWSNTLPEHWRSLSTHESGL